MQNKNEIAAFKATHSAQYAFSVVKKYLLNEKIIKSVILVQLIKVQIREDLALDVSVTPTDPALSALSAQAATPVLPVARISSKPSPALQATRAQVEISNKIVTFPTTPSGETSGREEHNH